MLSHKEETEENDASASSVSFSLGDLASPVVPVNQPTQPLPPSRQQPQRVQSLQHNRSSRRVSINTSTEVIGSSLTFPERPAREIGARAVSTTVRLSRQGFRSRAGSQSDFAVRSIRRGSDDWHGLIKPFCADIVFRSLKNRRYQSEISFVPYTCHAAVVFIDLSGYSKIAAAIAHKGAHALSSVVNSYLSDILQIVHSHGGDVVKFAGDAVLVIWEGTKKNLDISVKCAVRCAMEIQKDAGSYPVDAAQNLHFRNHIGVCCGRIESEVFKARTHVNMQKLYHSIGGDALNEISEVVDLARAGEVCVDSSCLRHLEGIATFRGICPSKQSPNTEAKIITELNVDENLGTKLNDHIEMLLLSRLCMRNVTFEEDFIHPSVLRQLSHGGHDPTQVAQIRNLCVLFIAMTSSGSSVNWLMEVQGVLDKNRCPIVQIIDDDKGVHLVAAVNLYEAIPEAQILGLDVAKELMDKHVGCAIGMAMGATFCGVTGSAAVACRWDITGPPPVRAARLMQYCLTHDQSVAIDQSVYNDPVAAVRMCTLHSGIQIKGTEGLCPIYTLSHSTDYSAFRVLETVHGAAHNGIVREIQKLINGEKSRTAVVVTGPTLSGKKIVCQRAAGFADLVPYLHVCEENRGLLQLARTIATWFKYIEHSEVRRRALDVLEFLSLEHWTRAHDECVKLLTFALANGISACFLVDRIQFLDEFSFSLMRECLHGRMKMNRLAMSSRSFLDGTNASFTSALSSDTSSGSGETGRIVFLCTHVPLYNWMDAFDVVSHLTRSHRMLNVPVIEVSRATLSELRTLFRDVGDMGVGNRWLDTYAESSGFCAGYFVERAAASRTLSSKLWSEGKPGYAVTTEQVELHIPAGQVGMNKHITVHQTSPEVVMRYSQVYDELPPLFQTVCKVLTIATRRKFFRLPKTVLWEALNDLVAEGVELGVLDTVLEEMEEMFLVLLDAEKDQLVVSFLSPAFTDIVLDVCTPVQIESMTVTLIDRLDPISSSDFRIPLVIATLYEMTGKQEDIQKEKWKEGFEAFQATQDSFSLKEQLYWLELMQDEINGAGFNVEEVLGGDFCCYVPHKEAISSILPMLKIYQAPICMGQASHSLAVLFLNVFHEYGNFHGAPAAKQRRLARASKSASERYFKQMGHLEEFLSNHGLEAPSEELEQERDIIEFIASPPTEASQVVRKAERVLNELVPQVIKSRMDRMHKLVDHFRSQGRIPDVVDRAEPALRGAYHALQVTSKDRNDAAQDALMTMATMNWKPETVPEHMCIIYQQTVARLRNKVLKRLTPAQLVGFRHQQTVDDLEAFLIVTPLLDELKYGTSP